MRNDAFDTTRADDRLRRTQCERRQRYCAVELARSRMYPLTRILRPGQGIGSASPWSPNRKEQQHGKCT